MQDVSGRVHNSHRNCEKFRGPLELGNDGGGELSPWVDVLGGQILQVLFEIVVIAIARKPFEIFD
jgi:hypothetical protein